MAGTCRATNAKCDGGAEEMKTELAKQGHVLEEFTEADIVKKLAQTLPSVYKDQTNVEHALEKLTLIVDKYQEQRHLMDPYLEEMLLDFLSIARQQDIDRRLSHLAFKFLYLLTKSRGPKIVVRLLPHEVIDLEPTLNLLYAQNPVDFQTWESRYMLLLWMSILCMIPLDMSRLDTAEGADHTQNAIIDRILKIGKRYLVVNDRCRDAAAFMVSRFLTRPDVQQQRLPAFLHWCLKTVTKQRNKETVSAMSTLSGILSTLAQLFKHGKRKDLVQYAPVILPVVTECKLFDHMNAQVRKLTIKLIQRLGLTFLPARITKWRYHRGNRSLADNLQASSASMAPSSFTST